LRCAHIVANVNIITEEWSSIVLVKSDCYFAGFSALRFLTGSSSLLVNRAQPSYAFNDVHYYRLMIFNIKVAWPRPAYVLNDIHHYE